MAIKMRVNHEQSSNCFNCGTSWKNTPEMYDLCIGYQRERILPLCKKCVDELFQKTLKAGCKYNARIKSQEDQTRIKRSKQIDLDWEEAIKGYEHRSVAKTLKGIKLREED